MDLQKKIVTDESSDNFPKAYKSMIRIFELMKHRQELAKELRVQNDGLLAAYKGLDNAFHNAIQEEAKFLTGLK